jgi:Fe-S oxidoreductase
MATYKAEFLAHYYAGRLRPRSAYVFGYIDRWARLAAHAPGLVNALMQASWSSGIAKWVANVAPTRRLPRFADESFQHRFARRAAPPRRSDRQVVLWPDTFNNYFHPETALAALDVLEAAGFAVTVPASPVCCGRPLYDSGMLRDAQRYLRRILARFEPQIDAGVPFVVLEPACAAVFRDEMMNLFPGDEVAKRLSAQTFLLAEFLAQRAPDFAPPRLARSAIVHGHCHQKAIIGMGADEAVLRKLGVDYTLLDSGCCGMAGSFGFEREKAAVSVAIGERVLLPAVRDAASDCLVIADGYSCREQIAQCTNRHALHLAEVVSMALAGNAGGGMRAVAAAPDIENHAVSH